MSNRLSLDQQLPHGYERQAVARIIRAICDQVNLLSESRIQGRYNAQSTVPAGGSASYQVGDIVWDTNPTVVGSVAPGVAAQYVRIGWICTVAGTPGTFNEVRVLNGS